MNGLRREDRYLIAPTPEPPAMPDKNAVLAHGICVMLERSLRTSIIWDSEPGRDNVARLTFAAST